MGIEPQTERAQRIEYLAGNLLSRAALLVRLLVKQVRNNEISRTEGEVLSILSDGPRRITELAELEGVAQPTMTLLIKRMQESGWVTREGLPQDGRVVMVGMTPAGSAVADVFRAQFHAALRTDLERLTDEHLAALCSATESLSAFVEVLQQPGGR
jgi:DNA-binding MarR family transcriptional regulator